jgi:hypothetical protein
VAERLDFFKKYMYQLMKRKAEVTQRELEEYRDSLSKSPTTLPEFAKFIETLNASKDRLKFLENEKTEIELMHAQLRKMDNQPLSGKDTYQLEEIQKLYDELQTKIKEAEDLKKDRKPEMITRLDKEIQDLQKYIQSTANQVNSGKLSLEEISQAELLKDLNVALKEVNYVKGALNDIRKQIEKYRERDKNYTNYQKLMDLNPQPNQPLAELDNKYNDRKLLWTNIEKFAKCHEEWFKNPFQSLETEEFEQDMRAFEKSIIHLKQNITNLSKEGKDKVLDLFTVEVKQVSVMQPIIMALGNKDIKAKHWK